MLATFESVEGIGHCFDPSCAITYTFVMAGEGKIYPNLFNLQIH